MRTRAAIPLPASPPLTATIQKMSDQTKPITAGEFAKAITDISDQQIELVKAQLLNSIDRLLDTNLELAKEVTGVKTKLQALKPDDNHDELKEDLLLFLETIRENNDVIDDQVSRVKIANAEMVKRGTMASSSQQTQETKLDDRVSTLKLAVQQEMGVDVVWNMVKDTDDLQPDSVEEPQSTTEAAEGAETADTADTNDEGVYL